MVTVITEVASEIILEEVSSSIIPYLEDGVLSGIASSLNPFKHDLLPEREIV